MTDSFGPILGEGCGNNGLLVRLKARGSPHHFSGYQTRAKLTEVRISIREDT